MPKILLMMFLAAALYAGAPAFAANPDEETAEEINADPIQKEMNDDDKLREAARKFREQERLRRQLDNEANYEREFDNRFNVTPGQIRKARKRQEELEQAAQLPIPGKGQQRSIKASLEPGAGNPVIRCYPQYAVPIRVLDEGGNPWPIMAHMIGNAQAFQVQKPDMEPYDTIIVSPLVNYGSTNLVLALDNNDGENPVPPLVVQLVVSPDNSQAYDSSASVRVNRRGPRSPHPTGGGGNFQTDDIMLAFLDGTPPEGALRLKSTDRSVEAWEYMDSLYIRAPKKIVWPAWTKEIGSGEKSGQTYAYQLPMVPSVMFSGNKHVSFERYPQGITRAMQGK